MNTKEMKITILSKHDYGGSGHKLWEALKWHTEHDVEIFTGKYHNPYRHPDHSKWNRRAVQQSIDDSDIIHLKGDWIVQNRYMGFKILHKPIVHTVSGSHFRKIEEGGYGVYKPAQYKYAVVRTSFEPDLLYPEYSDTWTPHPINSCVQSIEWKESEPPLFVHSPTHRKRKGTEFIEDVFAGIKKHRDINVVILEDMPFSKVVQQRKRATIFFDQFFVGFYGNSALEAMQYGVPVAAWISPLARSQARGMLSGCPVITTDLEIGAWVKKINEVLDSDMEYLSRRTKIWCDAIHGYQWVADQWNDIYNAI